ncbi:dihydrosphingosine 1-phosphate phosphatase Lcb3p [Trichomonascus vanleenenianus]|uniref:phosphatase PAP2 family protein n=1 Tax=Trichomonascus vanleenenianus TaxID=2268995 RepID=UPI003ECA8020
MPEVLHQLEEEEEVPFPILEPNPLTPPVDTTTRAEYFAPSKPSQDSLEAPADVSRSSSLVQLLAAYEKPPCADKDAGNKSLDHYKTKLPPWRNALRNAMLPLVRWETPHLAYLQRSSRSLVLDIYFAMSANLGTHTFYVVMLPVGFWFGCDHFPRDLVFVLSLGVYITGVLKDLLCLPRPLSPPLHRITMSGSAALEYGFPSTHSANAVAVGMLVFTKLMEIRDSLSPAQFAIAQAVNLFYVFSIVWGRIHCGMHGFLDVVIGSAIGVFLWWVRLAYGQAMDAFVLNYSSVTPLFYAVSAILFLVWIHPEPADDCPCFDDAVAFLGVLAGLYIGQWHFGRSLPFTVAPFSFASSGIVGSVVRPIIGVALVVMWRSTMKQLLLKGLPPVYRFFEKVGVDSPRKFFTPASQYKEIPPSVSSSPLLKPQKITSLFTQMISKPKRSDSVGPQSSADVYESLAYREYQRQKKKSASRGIGAVSSGVETMVSSSIDEDGGSVGDEDNDIQIDDDSEMLSTVVVPRKRYDVEVVTKLIVYAGISIIAVDLCGVLFLKLGI